jgi:alpha-tubulin suppressor-like RCC1 family protein
MIRTRVLVLAASAVSAGVGTLGACGTDDPRRSFVEEPDSGEVPEASAALPTPGPEIEPDATAAADADAGPPSKPDYDASDEAVVCTTTPCATQLAAGESHFCALLSDGTVRCWGDNFRGALGMGSSTPRYQPPVAVVGITDATQISAALTTTCVRTAGGGVKCWGQNAQGQLGLQVSPAVNDSKDHPTPTDVPLEAGVERVDVGYRPVCAVGTNSVDVYCWGANDQAQLARPDAGTFNVGGPGLADCQGFEVTRTTGGLGSAFGVAKDGQLVGWGAVSGRPTSISPTAIMTPIPSLQGVTSVAAGTAHQCAIASGRVYCWGTNSKGLLGTGTPDSERFPAPAAIVTDAKVFPQQLAVSPYASCVRMTDGTIHCAGADDRGQLGRGTPGTYSLSFVRATAFEERAVQVATSYFATCALVQGGKVVCWGGNTGGELGSGTRDSDPHPTPVTVVLP